MPVQGRTSSVPNNFSTVRASSVKKYEHRLNHFVAVRQKPFVPAPERKEGRKGIYDGRTEENHVVKEGTMEGRKEGRREHDTEGRKEDGGRREGGISRKEGRKEGRKPCSRGRNHGEGRKDGTKDGRNKGR